MSNTALIKALAGWAGTALDVAGDHCLEVRPRFRIPGAGRVDLLTVRHSRSDHFEVGLWSIEPGPLGDAAVDAMTRRIHAFEAWYGELREHAETQGFNPGHRIRVRGNLIGRSIRRSPLLDLLSNWACGMNFWTWKRAGGGLEISPCYGRAPGLSAARGQLKSLLAHLPWQDVVEREESPAALRNATPS